MITSEITQIKSSKKNVSFLFNTVVEELEGDEQLSSIMLRDLEHDKAYRFKVDGIFVAIGQEPENKPFENLVSLNDYGYINAGEDCIPNGAGKGIYVAGDCRSKRIRQVATAVADGAIAATNASIYLESLEN